MIKSVCCTITRDLSSDLRNPHNKLSMVLNMPVTTVLCGVDRIARAE